MRGRVTMLTPGKQLLDDAAHRCGAEEQRLLAAAEMEHAVGEDMAALEIAGELDFVDGEEGGVGLRRHRLDRAHAVARRRRDDLLLAGDQRHLVGADPRHDAVIDLAGEQAERQADHAGRVAEHPLDGEMGLAGIGRSEDGDHDCGRRRRGAWFRSHAHTVGRGSVHAPGRSLAVSGRNLRCTTQAPIAERTFRRFDDWIKRSERVWNKTGPNR